jgi:hypothetical protein
MNRVFVFLFLAGATSAAHAGDPAFYDNERINSAAVTVAASATLLKPQTSRSGDPAFYDNERINRLAPEDQAGQALTLPVAIQIAPAGDPAFYDNEPQRLKSGAK